MSDLFGNPEDLFLALQLKLLNAVQDVALY